MDATHGTNKYNFPLFYISVKDNCNRVNVVAAFIVQYESAPCIAEALNIFRLANPGWTGKYFLVDYSDPEINAVELTLPWIIVLLGLWHVLSSACTEFPGNISGFC